METEIICPGIDEYMKPFLGFFHRSESRELAECYVTGLLMDGERKSVEPMSEKVNASERSMQRLLSDVNWDDEAVAAEYRRIMLAATSDPLGILVLDDTGFPKKGRDSVCVARQYCGASGKTENCQVGVSMTYVGWVSRPKEFHIQALSEPDMNLSAHPAPIVPVDVTKPAFQ